MMSAALFQPGGGGVSYILPHWEKACQEVAGGSEGKGRFGYGKMRTLTGGPQGGLEKTSEGVWKGEGKRLMPWGVFVGESISARHVVIMPYPHHKVIGRSPR